MTAHPEATCQRCGRENIVWHAPNDVWNNAVPDDGILCPVCFVKAAEHAGITPASWRLTPESHIELTAALTRLRADAERLRVLADLLDDDPDASFRLELWDEGVTVAISGDRTSEPHPTTLDAIRAAIDASRESLGAAVDRSRSSTHAPAAALTPSVSRPVDLEAWERLARAVLDTLERYRAMPPYDAVAEEGAYQKYIAAKEAFGRAVSDPERILGLIGEVRRAQSVQEQVQDLETTENGRKQEPGPDAESPLRRIAWVARNGITKGNERGAAFWRVTLEAIADTAEQLAREDARR